MILSYDEAYEIVDELAKDMPDVFYEELNGGVIMLEEECLDPVIPDLYIMGAKKFESENKWDEALDKYQSALKMNPQRTKKSQLRKII